MYGVQFCIDLWKLDRCRVNALFFTASDDHYMYTDFQALSHLQLFFSQGTQLTSPDSSLVTSRRDLDASERAPENLDPKTGMLGVTPAVVFKVGVSGQHTSGHAVWHAVCAIGATL